MPSYQKVYYCKDCKKIVTVDEKEHCKICGGSRLKVTWSVRFRVMEGNKEVQKRLTGEDTKKKMEAKYIDFMASYNPLQIKDTQSYIFEDLLQEYFDYCSVENEESTQYDKRHIFDLYILPHFKGQNIKELSKAKLLKWQNHIWKIKNPKTKKEYSWQYLTKIRGFLSGFLSYCEQIHDIPNQFRTIKVPKNKEAKKEIKFWELSEFNQFIDTVEDITWKTLWYVFMFTGARFNEVRALTETDIKNGVITINKTMCGKKTVGLQSKKATKNGKVVIKEMPTILVEKLNEYLRYKRENNISSEYLFGGDMPLAETTIRRYLKNHFTKAKELYPDLEYIHPHCFRHSYVSLLIELGVSTKVIAELIGDTEEQVIKTYGHLYKDAKSRALTLLDEHLCLKCA